MEELILGKGGMLLQASMGVQVLHNLLTFALFLLPCLGVMVLLFCFARIPRFIFRKMLHLIAFTGITLMLVTSESWQAAVLFSLLLVVILFPTLSILETREWYSRLLVEKSKGEAKRSLLLLFGMFIVLILIACGCFHKPVAAAAAILMWGSGDAMAALIGIPFGKHKVAWKITDGKKSWEGTAAMMMTATLCGILVLVLTSDLSLGKAVVVSLMGGSLGALTELISPSEYDTVTVPLIIVAVLLIMV